MTAAVIQGASHATLKERFLAVRSATMALCEPLETEDYIPQPVVDVSPPKWNIAHTTWFFEEFILRRFVPAYSVFDDRFAYLFNSYYNTVGDRSARDRRSLSRPTVEEIFAYRRHVDEAMSGLLGTLGDGTDHDDLAELTTLGINHEQQHQELFLSDLKFSFASEPFKPAYRSGFHPENESARGSVDRIAIGGGNFEIGHRGEGFCFDNELARHTVFLEPFEISGRCVTNSEFLEFISDGGYRTHSLWHSDGWDWIRSQDISAPLYWSNEDGEWSHFTLGGMDRLEPDAPVTHVSYYEASAYAEWSGLRLPTEFEWEAASSSLDWGQRWEWTNSAYLPYPGFRKPAGAVGEYNGKFMINQMVLRGASLATPAGHSRPTYRNFFHPHLRWQFTGIRLAR
ncbi:MAG: ergothioneine biosynthesis protein EgtB [Acidobacteria bacterium]|nr:ergothioneine biosynthesis protein EgtB [Acidobacteriota bacterium]MCW5949929.1 ergothioneine biosynthesis protein EgtB [Pyrinomonadaceae bacterium]